PMRRVGLQRAARAALPIADRPPPEHAPRESEGGSAAAQAAGAGFRIRNDHSEPSHVHPMMIRASIPRPDATPRDEFVKFLRQARRGATFPRNKSDAERSHRPPSFSRKTRNVLHNRGYAMIHRSLWGACLGLACVVTAGQAHSSVVAFDDDHVRVSTSAV